MKLGRAPFKAGWERSARQLDGSIRDAKKRPKVTSPYRIYFRGSVGHGGREKRVKLELDATSSWWDATDVTRATCTLTLQTTHMRL